MAALVCKGLRDPASAVGTRKIAANYRNGIVRVAAEGVLLTKEFENGIP